VRLGNMQSVLQITVGLKVAYFSFREIRTPAFVRYAKEFESVEKEVSETKSLLAIVKMPERMIPFDEATSLYIKRDVFEKTLNMHEENLQGISDPYRDNIHAFDEGIRGFAMLVAVIGFVMLFLASSFVDQEIRIRWFAMVTAISLLPTFVAIYYNWAIVRLLHNEFNRLRELRAQSAI
jgi:hypothetical protein